MTNTDNILSLHIETVVLTIHETSSFKTSNFWESNSVKDKNVVFIIAIVHVEFVTKDDSSR